MGLEGEVRELGDRMRGVSAGGIYDGLIQWDRDRGEDRMGRVVAHTKHCNVFYPV